MATQALVEGVLTTFALEGEHYSRKELFEWVRATVSKSEWAVVLPLGAPSPLENYLTADEPIVEAMMELNANAGRLLMSDISTPGGRKGWKKAIWLLTYLPVGIIYTNSRGDITTWVQLDLDGLKWHKLAQDLYIEGSRLPSTSELSLILHIPKDEGTRNLLKAGLLYCKSLQLN